MKELKTIDAIRARRSIRRFKTDAVPDEALMQMIEAARLAPSGCNAQPWRFKIVRDRASKVKLAHAAHRQQFIAMSPVVIVCCADVKSYLDRSVSMIQDLGRIGAVEGNVVQVITRRTEGMRSLALSEIGPVAALNVAIAVEHMALRALDFGLGTCWVRLFDEKSVREIFGWDEGLHVVCMMPVGYPAEDPAPRERMSLGELML